MNIFRWLKKAPQQRQNSSSELDQQPTSQITVEDKQAITTKILTEK